MNTIMQQVSGGRQRKYGNIWKVVDVVLEHSGHTPDPKYSKFYPCFRGLSHSERAAFGRLSSLNIFQRKQIVSLATDRLKRYVHSKDVSNALSKSGRDTKSGTSETIALLNALESADGWEVDIDFDDADETLPRAYFFTHSSWQENSKKWSDVILVDGTYKVRDARAD